MCLYHDTWQPRKEHGVPKQAERALRAQLEAELAAARQAAAGAAAARAEAAAAAAAADTARRGLEEAAAKLAAAQDARSRAVKEVCSVEYWAAGCSTVCMLLQAALPLGVLAVLVLRSCRVMRTNAPFGP